MSDQIDVAMVDTYRSGIKMLEQQTRNKLSELVFNSSETGERISEDFIGAVKARKKTSRHADTKHVKTPHKRRWLSNYDFSIADLLDWADVLKILNNPSGMYAQNFVAALHRERDTEICTAALGDAYTGKLGVDVSAFDTANQRIVHGGTGFTYAKIELAMDILAGGNVDVSEGLNVAWTRKQEKEFLQNAEVKSIDYNNQKVLIEGGMGSGKFYGFNYTRLEDWTDETGTLQRILGKSGTTRSCIAWAKNSIWFNQAKATDVKVDVLPLKDYSTQIWSGASFGATRSNDKGVVEIQCTEA